MLYIFIEWKIHKEKVKQNEVEENTIRTRESLLIFRVIIVFIICLKFVDLLSIGLKDLIESKYNLTSLLNGSFLFFDNPHTQLFLFGFFLNFFWILIFFFISSYLLHILVINCNHHWQHFYSVLSLSNFFYLLFDRYLINLYINQCKLSKVQLLRPRLRTNLKITSLLLLLLTYFFFEIYK